MPWLLQVAGRNFVQVLEKLGVEVRLEDVEFGSEEEENVVAKAVRRALVKFHPDRAAQRGYDVVRKRAVSVSSF